MISGRKLKKFTQKGCSTAIEGMGNNFKRQELTQEVGSIAGKATSATSSGQLISLQQNKIRLIGKKLGDDFIVVRRNLNLPAFSEKARGKKESKKGETQHLQSESSSRLATFYTLT